MIDLEKSAYMHRLNLHERIRKNQARCPTKILERIDAAFAAGEYDCVNGLCNHGGWGRMSGVADYPTNAEIKRVMDEQEKWFKDQGEDDKSEVEFNTKLLKMLKNCTL